MTSVTFHFSGPRQHWASHGVETIAPAYVPHKYFSEVRAKNVSRHELEQSSCVYKYMHGCL